MPGHFARPSARLAALVLAATGGWLAVGAATIHSTPAVPDLYAAIAVDDTARRFVLAPDGNEVRYRVREQLARVSFPSDAVGVTRRVTGTIVLNGDGTIDSDASRFVVDLASLQSDSDRRDNYIRRNTLRTEQFPAAVFVPTTLGGLPRPLPTAGEHAFEITGDLTINGVTRPTTWQVTAAVADHAFAGTAHTEFRFADFEMPIPRVASVLSVVDRIRLEYDFRLIAE